MMQEAFEIVLEPIAARVQTSQKKRCTNVGITPRYEKSRQLECF